MRTPMLALAFALALPTAGDALALTILDFPPPAGGYTGIRNYEVYAIRGVVRAEDLNEFNTFSVGLFKLIPDFSTFVDSDGLLFISLSGFGPNAVLGASIEIGQLFGETGKGALSGGPTAAGAYAGLNPSSIFGVSIGVGTASVGSPYEVRFSINPLPAPIIVFSSALAGLGLLRARRRRI